MSRSPAERRLYDPRQGDAPVVVESLVLSSPAEPPRSNRFSVYWIGSGTGTFWADLAQHSFAAHSLLFFVPYQRIRIIPSRPVRGTLLQFHANFLCVETFHAETGCSGALFNDPFGSPAVRLYARARTEVPDLIARIQREQREQDMAHLDAAVAYLKLLLIVAARLKGSERHASPTASADPRQPLLSALKDLVEQHYRTLHSPSEYASLLHVTPKTLNRLVRAHLGKTATELIRERILIHAKWELLHTLRPVKEVAVEVGFDDELYFSRLFKKFTGYSPTYFREFETAIRGGSNLSMPLSRRPIPRSPAGKG
jgi:AraC family transcriptional regulator, transcriptional activator of pobA